jgi:hypothetical protein
MYSFLSHANLYLILYQPYAHMLASSLSTPSILSLISSQVRFAFQCMDASLPTQPNRQWPKADAGQKSAALLPLAIAPCMHRMLLIFFTDSTYKAKDPKQNETITGDYSTSLLPLVW